MDPGAGPSTPNLSAGEAEEVPFPCSICFLMAWQPVITSCGHLYCWPCLSSWLRRAANCPVCRLPVNVDGYPIIPIFTTDRSGRRVHRNSAFLPTAIFVELGESIQAPAPLALINGWMSHTEALEELHLRAQRHTEAVGVEGQALPARVRRDVVAGELMVENIHITDQILESERMRHQLEVNRARAACDAELLRLREQHAAEMLRQHIQRHFGANAEGRSNTEGR